MGTGEDLKSLASSIIDSYEVRMKTVNGLMEQSYRFLRSFQTELEDMIIRLRDNLAKAESLRKKDFDRMMSDLTERRMSQEKEAENVFSRFQEEEMAMVDRLRKVITSKDGSRLEDMEVIREDILKRQKERETGIIQVLKRIQVEQEELKVALKRLLEKGESVRVRDFKVMLKSLRAQQGVRDNQFGRMLEELAMVRDKVQSQWQTAVTGH
jgi:hypothetical protein